MNEFEQSIFEFFVNTTINSFEDLEPAVQNLQKFGRRVWIAGSAGAVARAIELFAHRHFPSYLIEAHNTIMNWVQEPTATNAELAKQKYFPYRQVFNCNDLLDRSNRATSFAIKAISESDEESFRLAKIGMISMAHPFVLGEEQTWVGIEQTIKGLII